jgi:hypothetical protein
MYDWLEHLALERRRELLGESRERRLILQAAANQQLEHRPSLTGRSLAWVGGRLKMLGEHLEQRYGGVTPLQLETSEGC